MGRDGDTHDATDEGTGASQPVAGTKRGGVQGADGKRPARSATRVERVRWMDYADPDRKAAEYQGADHQGEYLSRAYTRGDRQDRHNWPAVVASQAPGDHDWRSVLAGEDLGEHSEDDLSSDAFSSDAFSSDSLPTSLSQYRTLSMARDLVGGSARLPVAGATADAWTRSLRRFARMCVWALPASAICLAVGTARGWPTAAQPNGGSGGSWLVLTTHGLALAVIGVVALMGLIAATRGRWLAAVAVLGTVSGAVLLAAVLGLIGLARPAGWRLGVAAEVEASVLDSAASRWLAGTGFSLLALGGVAAAGAILASGMLSRTDAALVLAAVGAGLLAAVTGWQFLIIIASMLLLAGGLGVCWTASRLTEEGLLRRQRERPWRESVRVPGRDDHRPR